MMDSSEDLRRFIRRSKSLGFTMNIGGKPFRAETLNYSLQGLGARIEGRPPLKQGDLLRIGQMELGNAGDASVAWARAGEEGTLVGLSLIKPFDSCFRYFRFSDILEGLRRAKKTGTFSLADKSGRRMYVKNGAPVFASSESPDDSLEMFLLRKGILNEEQYHRALDERGRTGKKEGAVLVGLGYIKPAELVGIARTQAEEIIMSMLADQEACFSFEEEVIPASDLITMNLSTSDIIYRGLKRTENSAVLEQYCPMMDDVVRFAKSGLDFLSIPLEDKDRKILSLVDGRTRLNDILRESPYDEMETIKTICALTGAGVIEPYRSEEAAERPTQPGIVGAEAAAVGPQAESALARFRDGKRHLALGRLEAAERSFREAVSIGPEEARFHHFLGLTLRLMGRTKEAGEALSEALRLEPTNALILDEINRLHSQGR
jgi:hypothetical protein